jgi:hypothetical protein
MYRKKILFSDDILIVDQKIGDVSGDGIPDTVYLVAEKSSYLDSPYLTNIQIIIVDGDTYKQTKINLSENSGYNPNLILLSFTNKRVKDIFVSIESGGSGGFCYYYIYSFINKNKKLLFDNYMFNNEYTYKVIYKDNYIVDIINETLKLIFSINIKYKDIGYINQLYYKNGVLKDYTYGDVLYLDNLFPVDINNDGVYELLALIGL